MQKIPPSDLLWGDISGDSGQQDATISQWSLYLDTDGSNRCTLRSSFTPVTISLHLHVSYILKVTVNHLSYEVNRSESPLQSKRLICPLALCISWEPKSHEILMFVTEKTANRAVTS